MNRSCPLCAATSAAARVSSRVLLMCSTFTCTSFSCPHPLIHVLSNQSSYAGTKCTHWMIDRSPLSSRCLNLSGPANEYGAEAPATPRATAPAPAFLISSRRSRRRSAIPPPFSTKCAAGETGDEPIEERVVDQCQGDARDQDRGHVTGTVERGSA